MLVALAQLALTQVALVWIVVLALPGRVLVCWSGPFDDLVSKSASQPVVWSRSGQPQDWAC